MRRWAVPLRPALGSNVTICWAEAERRRSAERVEVAHAAFGLGEGDAGCLQVDARHVGGKLPGTFIVAVLPPRVRITISLPEGVLPEHSVSCPRTRASYPW